MDRGDKLYQFGEFRFDTAKRILRRGETRVHAEGRVLDLLRVLIEQRGRTISRGDLMRAVWGEAQVSDGSLRRTVSLLRKAIDARGPVGTGVETVHGRGYRFTAQVRELREESPDTGLGPGARGERVTVPRIDPESRFEVAAVI